LPGVAIFSDTTYWQRHPHFGFRPRRPRRVEQISGMGVSIQSGQMYKKPQDSRPTHTGGEWETLTPRTQNW